MPVDPMELNQDKIDQMTGFLWRQAADRPKTQLSTVRAPGPWTRRSRKIAPR